MNKIAMLLRIAFSPYSIWARAAMAAIAIIYITGAYHTMIDVANYAIPDEYLPAMLIAVLVMGFLTSIMTRRFVHDRAANKKIKKGEIQYQFQLEYDRRYDVATAFCLIVCAAIGIFAAPLVADAYILNAGMWTYVIIAGVITAITVPNAIFIVHYGVRKWVIEGAKWVKSVVESLKEAAGELEGVKDDVDDLKDLVTKEEPAQAEKPAEAVAQPVVRTK